VAGGALNGRASVLRIPGTRITVAGMGQDLLRVLSRNQGVDGPSRRRSGLRSPSLNVP